MQRDAWVAAGLVLAFVLGLWLLIALGLPGDAIRLYVVSPVLLVFGLLGVLTGLAWLARRLRI